MSRRRRWSNRETEFYVYTPGVAVPRDVTHVIVPASVEVLPERAFLQHRHLKKVVLSAGLRTVGEQAFRGCRSLVSVHVSATLVEIGDSAFRDCTLLREFSFPEGLTRIGGSSFSGCSSLVCLCLPSTVIEIPYGAFLRCSSLKKITLPDGIREIGCRAFSHCSSLEDEVVLPATVTTIGPAAFKGCRVLRVLRLSLGVKRISSWAFQDCDSLDHVVTSSKALRVDAIGSPTGGDYFFQLVTDENTFVHSPSHLLITSECFNSMSLADMSEFQLEITNTLGPVHLYDESWVDEAWATKLQMLLALVALHESRHKKEVATLLELGLWKSKIVEDGLNPDIREDCRLHCGAGVIIGNVLPFLLRM